MDTIQTICIVALALVLIGLCYAMHRLTIIVAVLDDIITIHDSEDSDEGS